MTATTAARCLRMHARAPLLARRWLPLPKLRPIASASCCDSSWVSRVARRCEWHPPSRCGGAGAAAARGARGQRLARARTGLAGVPRGGVCAACRVRIRLAEDAATSAAATLLHRVVGERERRQQAENALQRKEAPPLALQEELHTIKEALQLEVIAREAAEGKAQRLHRSHAALDSQLRIANESLARLMRESAARPGGMCGGRRADRRLALTAECWKSCVRCGGVGRRGEHYRGRDEAPRRAQLISPNDPLVHTHIQPQHL